MKKLINIILGILLLTNLISAQNTFEQANNKYIAGEYEEALITYESILNSGSNLSKELLFNMGNTYFKLGQVDKAILHYEKAKKYFETDNDIEANLEICRTKIIDKIPDQNSSPIKLAFKKTANLLSEKSWGILSILLLLITATTFILFRLSSKIAVKKISFYSSIVFLIIFSVSIALGKLKINNITNQKSGIIITSSVNVKSEPTNATTNLFVIHSGLKVEILREVKDWVNIKLSNDKQGWIKKNQISLI